MMVDAMHNAPTPPIVALGLDPRGLHLMNHPKVQSPRVKPEGDARREESLVSRNGNTVEDQKDD